MKKRRCFLFRSLRTAVTRKVVPRFRCSLHRIYTYKTCYDQCCFSKLLVSQCLMPSLTGNKSDSTDVLNNWTCVRCTFIPVELRSKSLASTGLIFSDLKFQPLCSEIATVEVVIPRGLEQKLPLATTWSLYQADIYLI